MKEQQLSIWKTETPEQKTINQEHKPKEPTPEERIKFYQEQELKELNNIEKNGIDEETKIGLEMLIQAMKQEEYKYIIPDTKTTYLNNNLRYSA